jgi:hypothetical protein
MSDKGRLIPHVTRIVDHETEGFHINSPRYVVLSRSPEHANNPHYVGESTHTVFTFDGVRSELATHFRLTDEEIDQALQNAPTIPGILPAKGGR